MYAFFQKTDHYHTLTALASRKPFPSAADVFPMPTPQKMCIYRLLMFHLELYIHCR